ncbi:MAG: hypothetical protein JNJ57_11260 [Saprospiraceae bacterium]|nr:hypothetical protein [Saprospiraceae bacterium]
MNELTRFVWEHREDEPASLALSAKKHPHISVAEAARQVAALQKIKKKAPGWYRPGILFPPLLSIEQASSEACARFKISLLSGSSLVDLSAGMGVDSSFFAEKFNKVTALEPVAEIAQATTQNMATLGLHQVQVVQTDAESWLRTNMEPYDWMYIDPARRDKHSNKVFHWADCTPNVLEIKDLILKHAPNLLIKSAPLLDISLAIQQLKTVQQVWVLELEGEVREVLYHVTQEVTAPEKIPVTAITLHPDGTVANKFAFTREEEAEVWMEISEPMAFLYQPFAAVMKAGAFRSFATRYGLSKLHQHTHLYTSDMEIAGIPARRFQLLGICKYDKKEVQHWLGGDKAHVSTRNFPEKTELVRKKLGLKDGGDHYVFAVTLHPDSLRLLVCKKC